MKDFIEKIQKDIMTLQKTLQKSGDDMVKRLEHFAKSPNVKAKTDEIQNYVTQQVRKIEPAVSKFYDSVKNNAQKAGLDLDPIEKKVKEVATRARMQIGNVTSKTKSKDTKTSSKSNAAPKSKAPRPIKK